MSCTVKGFLVVQIVYNAGDDGYPLQCSCLENSMDRGAWWATVHGITESQTRLKQLSTHKQEY